MTETKANQTEGLEIQHRCSGSQRTGFREKGVVQQCCQREPSQMEQHRLLGYIHIYLLRCARVCLKIVFLSQNSHFFGLLHIKMKTKEKLLQYLHFTSLQEYLHYSIFYFPGGSDGKSICLQCGRPGFHPWVRKIPWRRKQQPTPVLLPGKSHGQRSLVDYSPWGHRESDTTERLHFSNSIYTKCIRKK